MREKCDGLIVVGTALATNFAKKIVLECIKKETVPIVEVNLEANIVNGYTINLFQKSEECLPELFNELKRLQEGSLD